MGDTCYSCMGYGYRFVRIIYERHYPKAIRRCRDCHGRGHL